MFYFQSIWFPNVIYVEESIYDRFLTNLKYNFTQYNLSREKFNENGIESRKILNNFIEEKQGQGYEVILFNLRNPNIYLKNYNEAI